MPQVEGDDGQQTAQLSGNLVQAGRVPGLLASGACILAGLLLARRPEEA
jgi:hypothetical protein